MFCALQAHVPRHYRKAKGAFLSTASTGELLQHHVLFRSSSLGSITAGSIPCSPYKA